MRNPLWLLPVLLLAGCGGTPPPPAAPEPEPEVQAEPEPAPQPYENGVISVPISPLQELPPEW
ncbi:MULTISPECIES: hypothetical protein [Oceanimonas]|uniref:Uncharacterized protein n=1 Tax=Oceanimonas doudoroffii TaxID=84158 RepID=A0A233RDU1_9GAMM|nr:MULTISPECIES: hypothetical protein [Oceanimonas]NHH99101.1 hypothetical protein [Oceanimonas sp. MB9]OXY81553.1 hypothetical protein B6S08_11295 [Oceanimonas doudoroffii]